MKRFLSLIALSLILVLLALPMVGCSKKESRQVVVYTWADYFDPEQLTDFTAQTGIEVVYNYFDSNEEMLAKLEANGGSEYDVVLASDYIINIARKEGLLMELDQSKLSNYSDLDPAFLGQFYDPNNQYTVPYAAGTPLIVYDPSKVTLDIKGYADLWDPSLKDSIVMMDDVRNVLGITLKTMGQSFNTTDPEILKAAGEKLNTLKPNIRALDYNTPHEVLGSGEASVGYMFTPQILWALSMNSNLKVVYPAEGMGFGIDSCVIPVNAPHSEEAHEFLNYFLKPENSARASEFTMYINCGTKSKEYLSEEYRSNPALYIPSEILGQTEFIQDLDASTTELMDQIWTAFKQQ